MEQAKSPEQCGPDGPRSMERSRALRAQADDEVIAALDARVETLFDLLGKAHALSIMGLFAVEGGPWRFSELEERLDVSPHTLSERLTELTEAGLLEREQYEEIPPRVEYTWTESARDLSPAMQHLYCWCLEHDLAGRDPAGDVGAPSAGGGAAAPVESED